VPEWYYLPFYAILRAITFDVLFLDAKFLGVLMMFGSIAVMALAPWLDTSPVRSGRYRPMFKWWFLLLCIDFIVLMWCGARPAEGLVPTISLIGAIYWFAYFLVILPLLGFIEKTDEVPETIEADFDAHYPPKAK
jgi:ubiquinol-cytochrome c reductase cytochrome b subunit